MTELIVGMVFGMIAGIIIFRMFILMSLQRAHGDLSNLMHVIEQLEKTMISVRVEQHDGIFYAYNVRDDSFVAQGSSIKELKEAIDGRWKDMQVFVSEGDPTVIEALKATESK